MCQREQIDRGKVRAQISVQVLTGGNACIFCPTEVAAGLHAHLAAKHVGVSQPVRAIFGRYPTDQLIAAISLKDALSEIAEFVRGLPEICYARDVQLEFRGAPCTDVRGALI